MAITPDTFPRQKFGVCTAEAVSAKVFKLLHYAGFSSIPTLEAVRYVVPANSLEIEVSAQVLKKQVSYLQQLLNVYFLVVISVSNYKFLGG